MSVKTFAIVLRPVFAIWHAIGHVVCWYRRVGLLVSGGSGVWAVLVLVMAALVVTGIAAVEK